MKLGDLAQRTAEWLRTDDQAQTVAISSRVRLARNLAGMPFLARCTEGQQAELEQRLRDHIASPKVMGANFYVDLAAASDLDLELLVERHLISRHHADADCPRGVAVSNDETVAIMINEEDHVRMQVLRSGLGLNEAMEQINRIDDLLEQQLDWAFHGQYGYLTACPTNVGTGLRISVMLHLPALRLTGEFQKAFQAARDMHLAFRSLYGEGTEASGDFFQLSNQTTLGKTEEQIVAEFTQQILPGFIQYELRAREALAHSPERAGLEDKIFRAVAMLQSARRIGSVEMMDHLSLVRLGVGLGQITGIPLETINELFLLAQPAHLQQVAGHPIPAKQRAEMRATLIRDRLGGN